MEGKEFWCMKMPQMEEQPNCPENAASLPEVGYLQLSTAAGSEI